MLPLGHAGPDPPHPVVQTLWEQIPEPPVPGPFANADEMDMESPTANTTAPKPLKKPDNWFIAQHLALF